MMLFESGPGLVVNAYCKSGATAEYLFRRSIIDMLKEGIKWHHVKCSAKIREGKIEWKTKKVVKDNEQKTVTNILGQL